MTVNIFYDEQTGKYDVWLDLEGAGTHSGICITDDHDSWQEARAQAIAILEHRTIPELRKFTHDKIIKVDE